MPLASTLPLSAHFVASELGADKPEANDTIIANLRFTAERLESVRSVLDSRLLVNDSIHRNRGFRTTTENETVGGSPTSDHTKGLSADVTPLDMLGSGSWIWQASAYEILTSVNFGPYDQIIFYPGDGHIHFGFGPQMRREIRVKLFEGTGGTPLVTSKASFDIGRNLMEAATRNPSGAIVVFAAALMFLLLVGG